MVIIRSIIFNIYIIQLACNINYSLVCNYILICAVLIVWNRIGPCIIALGHSFISISPSNMICVIWGFRITCPIEFITFNRYAIIIIGHIILR